MLKVPNALSGTAARRAVDLFIAVADLSVGRGVIGHAPALGRLGAQEYPVALTGGRLLGMAETRAGLVCPRVVFS